MKSWTESTPVGHPPRAPGSRARRRRYAVLAGACLALLVFPALAQSVTASRSQSKPSPQIARFYLAGTNGYKVSVFASVEGVDSPVDVSVENLKGGAEYEARGLVTGS